jgi:hypothetical protein
MDQEVNRLFTEQLNTWELARNNYAALADVHTKELNVDGSPYKVQFNAARIVSSGAKVDARSIKERKCFLCPQNLPAEQKGIPFLGHYQILVNPFPIFPRHLTIPEVEHVEQLIAPRFGDMLELAKELTDYVVFYNGPKCGASAPDHAHFQAGNKGFMPIEKTWNNNIAGKIADYGEATLWYLSDMPRATLVIEATDKKDAMALFEHVYQSLSTDFSSRPYSHDFLSLTEKEEPMMNILAWYEIQKSSKKRGSEKATEKSISLSTDKKDTICTTSSWIICIFPREKHRPACYSAEGNDNLLSSPASVDLGGVFILPVGKDFMKIKATDVKQILSEVCLPQEKFRLLRQRIKESLE